MTATWQRRWQRWSRALPGWQWYSGLVAFYLGPLAAFALYLFNLLVIAITGRILSNMMPEDTPGLILEMPTYRIPTLKNVIGKAWFRVREFVVEAWPILIAGSAVLAILNFYNAAIAFNWLVRPLTWSLGLPSKVGVPLIFRYFTQRVVAGDVGPGLGNGQLRYRFERPPDGDLCHLRDVLYSLPGNPGCVET